MVAPPLIAGRDDNDEIVAALSHCLKSFEREVPRR
jgi:hypothetical protein